MALSRNQVMNLMQMQTQSVLNQQKAQQDALAANRPIMDALDKWGGGFMQDFRSNNPTFDKLLKFYRGEGPVQMNWEFMRTPESNPFGFQAPGGPQVGYMDIIDAYEKAGKFNPLPSLQLMQDFNRKYGLGLTPEQMAQGAEKFGEEHKKKWGVGFGPSSNNLAIAMSSLSAGAGGLDNYGTSEGMKKMWAENQPKLAQWDQDALASAKQLADRFDADITGRTPAITKYHNDYLDSVDKAYKKSDKAFLKSMGTFALSAFTPGLSGLIGNTFNIGNVASGAIAGGLTGGLGSAITGGDVGKGLLGGAVSGGIGGYAKGIGGDKFLGVGLGDVVKAGGNVAGGLIQGKDLSGLLQGAAGSLVGTGAGHLAGGFLKDAGLGNQLSGLGGKFVGNVANSLVRGKSLQDSLLGAGIGAGAGLLGGAVGSEFGNGAGELAGSLVSGSLNAMLQQKRMQDQAKQMAQGRPQIDRSAQMAAAWQKMTPQQRAAIVARARKG